jgi:hypothetical protein
MVQARLVSLFFALSSVVLLASCGKDASSLSASRQLLARTQSVIAQSLPTAPRAWPLLPEEARLLIDRCTLRKDLGAPADLSLCDPDGLYGAAAGVAGGDTLRPLRFKLSQDVRAILLTAADQDLRQIQAAYARVLMRQYWEQRRLFEIKSRWIRERLVAALPEKTSQSLANDPVAFLPAAQREQLASSIDTVRARLAKVQPTVAAGPISGTLADMGSFVGRLRQQYAGQPLTLDVDVVRTVDDARLTSALATLDEIEAAASPPDVVKTWLEMPTVLASGPLWRDVIDSQWRLADAIDATGLPGSTDDRVAILDQKAAEQLVGDCDALKQLDPSRAETVCSDNPALDWAREHFATNRPSRPAEAPGAGPNPPPGSLESARESRLPERTHMARDLETRIRIITQAFAEAWSVDQWQRHIEAEARLITLHRIIEAVLPAEERRLLSDDPLTLLSEATLSERRNHYQRHHRTAKLFASEFPLPILTHTEQSFANEIVRTDQALQLRAKVDAAAIAYFLDPEKFKLAIAGYEAKVKAEIARQREILAAIAPTLRAQIIQPEQPRPPPPKDPLHPHSGRILSMIEASVADPMRAIDLEARFRAAFAALAQVPEADRQAIKLRPDTSFEQWALAELNGADLARALADVERRARVQEEAGFESISPQVEVDRRRLEKLREWLGTELARRAQEGTSGRSTYPIDHVLGLDQLVADHLDGEPGKRIRDNWILRLSEDRWGEPSAMPPATRERIGAVYRERLNEDMVELNNLASLARDQQETMSRSADPLSPDERAILHSVREGIAELSVGLIQRYDFAIRKSLFSNEPSVREALVDWYRLFKGKGDGPDPASRPSVPDLPLDPPPSPPSVGRSGPAIVPNPLTGPGNRGPPPSIELQPFEARLAGSDPVWTRQLLDSRNHLMELTTRLDLGKKTAERLAATISPPAYATQEGRAIVDTPGIKADGTRRPFAIPEMALSREARLPARPDWTGWTKLARDGTASREFYDFKSEVIEPKTRDPIGGGVHFGNTAIACPAIGDTSRHVLRYDRATRKLFIEAPDGSSRNFGPVDPQVLKALWRFVSADAGKRNMAISIGWTGTKGDATEERTVLIDPFLVDTAVGRDLFLADTIPWALDQSELPNSRPNPVHPAFAERMRMRQENGTHKLQALINKISTGNVVVADATSSLSARLGFSSPAHQRREAMMIAILDADHHAARAGVLKKVTQLDEMRSRIASLERHGNISRMLNGLRSKSLDLEDYFEQMRKETMRDQSLDGLRSRRIDPEGYLERRMKETMRDQSEEDNKAIRAEINELEKNVGIINDWLSTVAILPESRVEAVVALLRLYLGEPTIPWRAIRALSTVLREQDAKISDGKIALIILEAFDRSSGLAVLMDREPARLCIDGEHLTLQGLMSYLYVDDFWDVESDGLALHPQTNRKTTIASDLSLQQIVNAKIEVLAREVPELGRVMEYSRLAAFLRWAREPGHLLGIDFADLAEVAAGDRVNTPTPDAVRE